MGNRVDLRLNATAARRWVASTKPSPHPPACSFPPNPQTTSLHTPNLQSRPTSVLIKPPLSNPIPPLPCTISHQTTMIPGPPRLTNRSCT
ncbi:hypothetical protein ACFX13_035376 [Malus domestica]